MSIAPSTFQGPDFLRGIRLRKLSKEALLRFFGLGLPLKGGVGLEEPEKSP